LGQSGRRSFAGFNLSDIFEYISPTASETLLTQLAAAGTPGARLVYWNMLAPRRRPATLAHQLHPLDALAAKLFAQDKAFFYSALVIEEVTAGVGKDC
jgi:S-adenosylmethionine-diacylglycerol 3-amino-3-carboxypropyl transferase